MIITKKLNLAVSGHKDINFIDIDDYADTRLYIDPYVIIASSDYFCEKAKLAINSFFVELFIACKTGDKHRIKELVSHASEPNETNLGMRSSSKTGKGTTDEELKKLLLEFYEVVRRNPELKINPMAISIYIKNFAEDKMSDLITNIIRKSLYEFTYAECQRWGIPLNPAVEKLGYFWDYETLQWKELYGQSLKVEDRKILLVPKTIVRKQYIFNVEGFIQKYILSVLQDEQLEKKSDMCHYKNLKDGTQKIYPPTKRELSKKYIEGTPHKDFALSFSTAYKESNDWYYNEVINQICRGVGELSDAQLDGFVYNKYKDIS